MKDKIITLSDNKKYLIIDDFKYNNEQYYFASLSNTDSDKNIYLLKLRKDNNKSFIKIVTNKDEITTVVFNYKKK